MLPLGFSFRIIDCDEYPWSYFLFFPSLFKPLFFPSPVSSVSVLSTWSFSKSVLSFRGSTFRFSAIWLSSCLRHRLICPVSTCYRNLFQSTRCVGNKKPVAFPCRFVFFSTTTVPKVLLHGASPTQMLLAPFFPFPEDSSLGACPSSFSPPTISFLAPLISFPVF